MVNKILIIDNQDSFTWNIYQYFSTMGMNVEVISHTMLNMVYLKNISVDRLVISPGPGRPEIYTTSLQAVCFFADKIPILGICLGHQIIANFFGAKIIHAKRIMHGKCSIIKHNSKGIFTNISQFINVVRYNSLIIDQNTIPSCLEITAWSVADYNHKNNEEIMAIKHNKLSIEGVQFHPESILSEEGYQMLLNFIS